VAGDIDRTALRVRLGLGLFIASWLPIAQVVIAVLGLQDGTAATTRGTIWAVQWVVGIAGLLIAGKAVATVIRRSGWRQTPRLLWRMLRTGRVVEQPVASTQTRQ
jgi:hypothetical protein